MYEVVKKQHGQKWRLLQRIYVFTQKTNLSKAGKKSCLFRRKNRSCHATISLQTGLNDGIFYIIEPFEWQISMKFT